MKSLLTPLLIMLPFFMMAQTEGSVRYTETVQLNIELPEGMDEEMMASIPRSQSNVKILHFNESESLFMDPPQDDESNGDMSWNGSSGGGEIRMVMRRPESRYYLNLDEGQRVEQREFFGKMFRIVDELPAYEWKITGEQKTILDYKVMEAISEDTARKVVAWFCPQIPVSTGPDAFSQLPGLVLEVNVNEGERTLVATEVKLEELEEGSIEKPTKGKQVSQQEFQSIVDEKMKEMEAEYGEHSGGGNRIIIRN